MSAKPEAPATADKAPAKSNKILIIIIAAVVVLALGGGGAFFYISKQRAAAEEEEDPAKPAHDERKVPPVYLPIDNMVVNLSDVGGDRVAQVGITLEVRDAKAGESVKAFLPTIRSGILLQLSQRTGDELLSTEGKKKLAKDILREASLPFGGGHEEEEHVEEEETPKKKKKSGKKAPPPPEYPVVGVHFSSFIVQ